MSIQPKSNTFNLSELVARRYAERTSAREKVLADVEREGVYAAAGVGATARRVAHMSLAEGRAMGATRTFEAVLGTDDSVPAAFLARGQRAARAVCRLTADGSPVGTGFLVAPGIVLTNNHVIASAKEASTFVAEFDYEMDLNDQPRTPVVRFGLDPNRLFVTSDSDAGLDFTFVAVAPRSVAHGQLLADFGWIPLDPRIDKILIGEPAVIVQHPRGEFKRVALFAAELVDKLDHYLHYTSDTDGGSSGSGVMNRSWQLVALHHAAVRSQRKHRGQPVIVNEGIRVSSILKALNDRPEHVVGDAVDLLAAISRPEVIGDGRPQVPLHPQNNLSESVPPGSRPSSVLVLERTSIRTQPSDHFSQRSGPHFGYKPEFLGASLTVPLPSLPSFLASDACNVAGGGHELRYTHYSVVQSKSRRLPYFTAVNIDGKSSKRLGRIDREFEAADVWYYDPRVPKAFQLGPEVYDRTDFDFGHMVRREDPVWGDTNTARMANDDTFYMTNCTPQHHDLNTKTWLALENAVLDAARNARARVSVFSGPVLAPQDPTVLGVQVPTAFWKIAVYAESGRLRAHGFMQWQTRLVRDLRVRREALAGLDDAEEYALPISDIARATSLDFGVLLSADVLGGESNARRRLNESVISTMLAIPHEPGTSSPSEVDRVASEVEQLPTAALGTVNEALQAIGDRLTRLERLVPLDFGLDRGADPSSSVKTLTAMASKNDGRNVKK